MSDEPTGLGVYAAVEKMCRRCKIVKAAPELKKDPRNKDGFSSFCKDCHAASSVAWQKANPDKLKAGVRSRYQRKKPDINARRRAQYDSEKMRWQCIRRLYRANREWYETTLKNQDNACAICSRDASEFTRNLSVDHDHACCPKTPTCGKCNRGLLCQFCNHALHSVERDSNWFNGVITYLLIHKRGQ